jgi:ATP-dependent RNA helicase DeaD
MKNFIDLNLSPEIIRGIEKKQYTEMTEVQEAVIPFALEGKDVIAQAPTGTGKTMAFAIPILEKIDPQSEAIQAIILSPTRELAMQIAEEMKEVSCYQKGVKITAIYGGEYIERQILSLKQKPQIIVATPGRLMDHMRRRTIKLKDVSMVVLDEADEMLNMGFREDIDTILETVVNDHQTLLLSATISKDIEHIGRTYLKNPQMVRVNKNELTIPSIDQKYIVTNQKDKIEIISRIIDLNDYNLAMVFCNTKKAVDEVSSELMQRGFKVEALHGDMKQMQRDRTMHRFKEGLINILVASDVAARGLDVDDVDVVFNYDVPTDEEYYVHRIGRTGRAKKLGLALTLVTKSERYRLKSIMNYAKIDIEETKIPSLDSVIKIRIERLIKEALENKTNNKYSKAIAEILESNEYSKDDLIMGLILREISDVDKSVEIIEENISVSRDRDRGKDRRSSRGNETRMFISLGRRDELKPSGLVDVIRNISGVTNNDINKIELYDNFSFFEVPGNVVDKVLDSFGREKHKGRRVTVEVAKEKRRNR